MNVVEHRDLTIGYLDRSGAVQTAIVAKSNPQFTWATGWGLQANRAVALRWDPQSFVWREVTKYGYVMAVSKRIYPELKIHFEQRAHEHLDSSLPEDAVPFERGQEWRDPGAEWFPDTQLLEVWAIA